MSLEALEKRFSDLQDRLVTLQDATNQLKDLIDRLANFGFQPGSVPLGATEDDNVSSELSTEINQILREQEEELELLNEEIIDIRPARPGSELQHDKERLKDGAQRLEQDLKSCRKSFRKAQISAKRNLQLAQRQERELLYASFTNPRSGASSPMPSAPQTRRKQQATSEMSKEEQIISASHDITQSLRRTHDLMAAELSKSDFAHNTLKESTMALSQLSENYSSLDTMLSNSRALLGTLLKSQKTDTWYLQSSFYILLVTLGWLVFRRLLWGPTWWLIWLPLKLLFRSAVGLSNTVGPWGSRVDPGSDSAGVRPGSGSQQVQMNNEGVPTIQVAHDHHSHHYQKPEKSQDPNTQESEEPMIEKVGKIIDSDSIGDGNGNGAEDGEARASKEDSANNTSDLEDHGKGEQPQLRERRADEEPNPKKRMMEEEPGTRQGDERIKDEL
ncbi:Sec20-domain-containing protein [Biscogniauxia mediterranea]|nr:Sec20-domain-containing protein [Biscogniauxia mediterranea]